MGLLLISCVCLKVGALAGLVGTGEKQALPETHSCHLRQISKETSPGRWFIHLALSPQTREGN